MDDVDQNLNDVESETLIDMGIQGGWGAGHELAFAKRLEQWDGLFLLAWETCARQGELAKAHWTEFDLIGRIWTIPADHTRSRKARSIPLTPSAVKTLKALMAFADDINPRVFHGLGKATPNPAAFARSMNRLGLKCRHVTELREMAIERMELRLKSFSKAEVAGVIGRPFRRYCR